MFLMGPVVDVVATVQNVIDMVIQAAQLVSFTWLLQGGIIYLIRLLSFWLDGLIVNFIGAVYKYFIMLLEGTMFNEAVVDAVMKNVYVFIGVIVFFRVAMLLLKYIVNPELVEDGKIGVNKLVKRVVIGMVGIILIPTIFSFAMNIQSAFLKDQVIQKIIIPEDILETSKNKMNNAGKFLGTYVWAGFLNPSTSAPPRIEKQFKSALKKADLSSLDVNSDGYLLLNLDVYAYNYFVFLSTFVLGYVLYLMIKYCLDLIGRLFKLFLYQLIAPIAMIEYMINGSDDGVFKSWKNAVLGTYFLLFVRVFALWFVIFVMTLMSGDLPNDTYVSGSLLATDDYLLRALIIVALLGFMMDLPKLLSNIFGIDLEQQGSASGLLDSIKGGLTKIAGAGLAMGGAAVGGIVGAAKGGLGSLNSNLAKKATNPETAASLQKRADKLGTWSTTGMSSIKGALGGMVEAGASSTELTKNVYGGYAAYKAVGDKVKAKNEKKAAERAQQIQEEREQARDQREIERDRREIERDRRDSNYQSKVVEQSERSHNLEIARMYNESPASKGKNPSQKSEDVRDLIYRPKMEKLKDVEIEIDGVKQKGDAGIQAAVDSVISSGLSVDVAANLVSDKMGSVLDVPAQEVQRIVKTVYEDPGIPQPEKSKQIVSMVYEEGQRVAEREATIVVNQVEGHRVMDTVDDINDSIDRLNTVISSASGLGRDDTSIDETE